MPHAFARFEPSHASIAASHCAVCRDAMHSVNKTSVAFNWLGRCRHVINAQIIQEHRNIYQRIGNCVDIYDSGLCENRNDSIRIVTTTKPGCSIESICQILMFIKLMNLNWIIFHGNCMVVIKEVVENNFNAVLSITCSLLSINCKQSQLGAWINTMEGSQFRCYAEISPLLLCQHRSHCRTCPERSELDFLSWKWTIENFISTKEVNNRSG